MIRRLVENALREAEERGDVGRWIASYRDQAPTGDEAALADLGMHNDSSTVPWE